MISDQETVDHESSRTLKHLASTITVTMTKDVSVTSLQRTGGHFVVPTTEDLTDITSDVSSTICNICDQGMSLAEEQNL